MAKDEMDADSVLTFLDEFGKRLGNIRAQAEGTNVKASDLTNIFNESLKRTTRTLGGMETVFSTMAKGLLAPAGLAAGFAAVAKSLETFAVSQVQLRAFSVNTGFAAENIREMQQAMRRMGMSTQEANNVISTLGNKLQNLRAFKEGSELWESLTQSQGGAALANSLKQLVSAGDTMGAVNKIIDTFQYQTREAKIALSQYFGVPLAVLEDYARARARGIKVWEESTAEAQKYHDLWVDYEIKFDNIYRRISSHAIKAFDEIGKSFSEQGLTQDAIVKWINGETDATLRDMREIIEEIKYSREWIDRFTSGGDVGKAAANELLGTQPYGKYGDWLNLTPYELLEVLQGRGEKALERIGKIASSREGWKELGIDEAQRIGWPGEREKEKELLTDIRDILAKFEMGSEGGGGGILFRPGIFGGGQVGGGWGGGQGQASRDFPVDQSGKPVDMETVTGLRSLAERGDTRGMQAYMQQRGYRVDSAWCGDLAKAFVQGSGYAAPKGYPIASNWRKWGQHIDPAGINVEGRPFGSIIASKTNVPIGDTGGHVMTVVPGTYDARTNTAVVADTHGQVRRSLSGFEVRYATDEAVQLAQERQRGIGAPPVGTLPSGGVAKALAEPDAPALAGVRRIGVTQNNPHNLKYTGSVWQRENLPGLRPGTTFDQGDRQAAFNSPQAGWNASAILALRKHRQGLTTVRSIISSQQGWTPGHRQAVSNVAGLMGVSPDADLDFNDPKVLATFLRALEIQEQGQTYYPSEMADIAARKAIDTQRATVDASLARTANGAAAKIGTVNAEINFKDAPVWKPEEGKPFLPVSFLGPDQAGKSGRGMSYPGTLWTP